MNSIVTYIEDRDRLFIKINPNLKGFVLFVYWAFYLIPLVLIIYFSFLLLDKERIDVEFVKIVGFASVAIIIGYTILKDIFLTETLIVTKDSITLSRCLIFELKKQKFLKADISDLRFNEYYYYSKHKIEPERKEYIDFKALDTVGFENEKDKVSFFVHGSTITFGKNVYEEDGIEIIRRINNFWRKK